VDPDVTIRDEYGFDDQSPGALLARRPAGELSVADTLVSDSVRERLARAVPENTQKAYAWWSGDFVRWCEAAGRTAMPATSETLTEYVNHLAEQSYAPSSIRVAIATIRTAHTEMGYERQPDTRRALEVLKVHGRDRADSGLRDEDATPVTVENLRRMIAGLPREGEKAIRDRAILVLGFALMARRSELVALNRGDIAETADGLEVRIRKSKTDQTGKGAQVNLPRGQFPDTDPVRVLKAWTDVLDEHGEHGGRVFRSIDRWGNLGQTLQSRAISDIVHTAAVRAHLPQPESYSAHSLRAGGATEAYRAGVPVTTICDHGRWKRGSPVVLGYIRAVDRWKDNAMLGVGL
jgi:integrase